jgi:hypothetical protein
MAPPETPDKERKGSEKFNGLSGNEGETLI